MSYNASWRLQDKNHGEWTFNESMFKSTVKSSGRGKFNRWTKKISEMGYKIGAKMGEISVHGVVYHFNTTNYSTSDIADLFVLKTVATNNNTPLIIQLQKEAFVGMIPNAPVPTVIAHRLNTTTKMYEILMRHLINDTEYAKKYASLTMNKYLTNYELFKPQNKAQFDVVLRKFNAVLVSFYKKTRHFHGDLHLNNIELTFEKKNPYKIHKIVIIDLGSVVPFPKELDFTPFRFVNQFMDPVTKAFKATFKRRNFNKVENSSTHGTIAWMQKLETSVIHNLQQKISFDPFWRELLLLGKKRNLGKERNSGVKRKINVLNVLTPPKSSKRKKMIAPKKRTLNVITPPQTKGPSWGSMAYFRKEYEKYGKT